MEHIVVIGAGVLGLIAAEDLLHDAERTGSAISISIVADRFGPETDSASGGAMLPFLSPEPRIPGWTSRSERWWTSVFLDRHPEFVRYFPAHGTLLVSRHERPVLVPGHLGTEHLTSPERFGLGHYYRSAAWQSNGRVINTCALLRDWVESLEADPRVTFVRGTFTRRSLSEYAASVDAQMVVLAPGYRAMDPDLLADPEMAAVEGILLLGPSLSGASIHSNYFVVDEDDSSELTYTIPHEACTGHGLMVGGSADEQPWAGLSGESGLTKDQVAVRDGILARARERFPDLRDWEPTGVWVGYRPSRDRVMTGPLEPDLLDGIPTVGVFGTGGSGWTIGPAAVEDALRTRALVADGNWAGC